MNLRALRSLDADQRFDPAAGARQPPQSENERPPATAPGAGPRSDLRFHPRVRSRTAEVAAIALFDLDGTITRRDTYLAYLLGFLVRHPKRWPRAAALPLAVVSHLAGWRSNTWLKATFLRAVLGGVPRSRLEAWTNSFLDGVLSVGLRPGALKAIEGHRAAGHRLVLVTASLDFYAAPLGRRLGFDAVLCTRGVYDAEGRVTGALDGENCYGEGKLRQVKRYLADDANALPVFCYSDHHADLPLLRFATEPVAVNPSRRLKRVSLSQGITIADWNR
jgi:phosphatidylglycerophosphatase C